jgi:methionyl-tRNA formyltransferase
MRIAFAGTPEFAASALRALIAAGHEVSLVLTQPDRPAGRGMKLQASPVKELALAHGLTLAQPRSLRLDGKFPEEAAAAKAALDAAAAEVMVVAAYGLILPRWVLDHPPLGCINIHASLLPRWRGAAPIHRAIEAGDAQTGITLMQMDEGLDTGVMLSVHALPIPDDATTASLHDALAVVGAQAVVDALAGGAQGLRALPRTPQPSDGVTYAAKIDKAEAGIDLSHSAAQVHRQIRALNPAPGAWLLADGEALKVWECYKISSILLSPHAGKLPIFLHENEVILRLAEGGLHLTEVQRAGGKRLAARDWARSWTPQQRAQGIQAASGLAQK